MFIKYEKVKVIERGNLYFEIFVLPRNTLK